MKKNRFAKLLLTGKAATLPLLITQAKAADVTPAYTDMISSELRVIEVPLGNSAMHLQSISADSNAASTYGSPYAAFFCTNELLGAASNTTFVVTGVNKGDTVYLAAASTKNDPLYLGIDKRLTIGTKNLQILGTATVDGTMGSTTVTFTAASSLLQQLTTAGRFYVQALVVPKGSTTAGWKYSELDEIVVGNCVTTAYGVSVY
jgi:hypothetical protein